MGINEHFKQIFTKILGKKRQVQNVGAWQQLTIPTSAAQADSLSDSLTDLGAVAVTFKDAGDEPILEPALHTTPLWQDTLLVALFEADFDIDPVLLTLKQTLADANFSAIVFEHIEEQPWERAWLNDFKPMDFGHGLWICPTGFEAPEPNATVVTLDPGLAFGTGTHNTTALCLEYLSAHPPHDQIVIDYGCGSGILGIAALKLGAKHVFAIDIDEQALQATHENADRNQLDLDHLTLDFPGKIALNPVDLIMANILAAPLISLAPELIKPLKNSGFLVLSGILTEQVGEVLAAYTPTCVQVELAVSGDWARLTLQKQL